MIAVFLNGQKSDVPTGSHLTEALTHWSYTEKHFAVAINQNFVPRSEYKNTVLSEGDSVEIVSPMQGG